MDKKRITAFALPALAGMAFLLILLLVMTVSSGYEAIIKERSGGYYRARSLFIAGTLFICTRDSMTFTSRSLAAASPADKRGLSIMSLNSVEFIEIIPGTEDEGPRLGSWHPALKDYIGDYTVNAAGNHGYLSLRASGSAIYGTIRFPDWGRGATEYLKNVRIVKGKLYFTRSVTTAQELKRLGASAYFLQQYSGDYYKSGNLIRGFYVVHGERKAWEANKKH